MLRLGWITSGPDATSGIAEMLPQSHNGAIRLPWPEGSATGPRARGGFELDIARKGSKLTAATIRSKLGDPCKLRYAGKVLEINMKPGVVYQVNGNLKPLQ